MRTSFILTLLFFLSMTAFGQAQQEKLIQQVLKSNTPRKNFAFKMKDKEKTTYSIKYLGTVTIKGGKKYKVVNYQTYFVPVGSVEHGHAIILIYTDQNKYAGAYDVIHTSLLPDYLEKQTLTFTAKSGCTETTKINLAGGLPEQIYIKCTDKGGNIYPYSTANPF